MLEFSEVLHGFRIDYEKYKDKFEFVVAQGTGPKIGIGFAYARDERCGLPTLEAAKKLARSYSQTDLQNIVGNFEPDILLLEIMGLVRQAYKITEEEEENE